MPARVALSTHPAARRDGRLALTVAVTILVSAASGCGGSDSGSADGGGTGGLAGGGGSGGGSGSGGASGGSGSGTGGAGGSGSAGMAGMGGPNMTLPLGAICANQTNCRQDQDEPVVCCLSQPPAACALPTQCPGATQYLSCTAGPDCDRFGGSKVCCLQGGMRFCTKPSGCGGTTIP
jgi:hypothetical protein